MVDEADEMLDMGFGKAIRKIVELEIPEASKRQTVIFSRTYPTQLQNLVSLITKVCLCKNNHVFLFKQDPATNDASSSVFEHNLLQR